jgi:hypothetical protein
LENENLGIRSGGTGEPVPPFLFTDSLYIEKKGYLCIWCGVRANSLSI